MAVFFYAFLNKPIRYQLTLLNILNVDLLSLITIVRKARYRLLFRLKRINIDVHLIRFLKISNRKKYSICTQ